MRNHNKEKEINNLLFSKVDSDDSEKDVSWVITDSPTQHKSNKTLYNYVYNHMSQKLTIYDNNIVLAF